jgi:hypothetical protein
MRRDFFDQRSAVNCLNRSGAHVIAAVAPQGGGTMI